MTKVNVVRDNKGIVSIEVKGHTNYDVEGYDIVCSAVSTAVSLTNNLLEKLKVNYTALIDEKNTMISLVINKIDSPEQSDLVQTILENLVEFLNEIGKEYNKNLKIYEIRR